ncbi:gliding motility-associated C-terminal domain-containing protein [uncultured Mucilaginibacter sp.]|uniref:T9SS type B sorting domain-containing protein n=1 Tax=uncultured Mucilaginibacter sp. TaxID=797541 RepID=UPI0025D7C9DA|nr:gliding motility-associated C-terminal domain-containing protein [uncultured Mucilaginibacter sp.]
MRLTLLIFLGLLISVGVIAQAPNISSFSPSSGPVGTLVTINGTNLNSPTAFSIGGATAIVISNTGTQLVGMVMPGAVTGNVSLTTAGGAGSAAGAFSVVATSYPAIQQGGKLLGTNNIRAGLGYSVALSADGNTAVLGGFTDNSNQGAVWVYVRSGGIWTQQGSKLVGTGSAAQAEQGTSVAISADGNTVVVGGYMDTPPGGAWVFSRSGTTWTQQAKLIGTGYTGAGASQGASVSISADGNTAIVGGPGDNSNQGAVWVFTRSNSVWSQKGNKLVGAGNSGAAFQGNAVAISGDGNTICAAGYVDNSSQGAVWIYTLNAGSWTQQGSKLVGTGNVGAANQGVSVALSADGNTALVGGYIDNNHLGAAWVFSRSGTIWAQQGNKLVGTGSSGSIVQQGFSVSLSADGNIAIVGGHYDNNNQGSVWVYSRAGISWTQQGNKLVGTGGTATALQGESVAVSADGNTLIVGGTGDNVNTGAAWAFTDALSPIVTTQPATAVTATGATLNGIVNDNGSITTVSIEYGTASNLAGSTIATLSSGVSPIASGTGNVSFTSVLTGLIPNTNYYFRINGVNGSGTANGAILSFTTQSGVPTITSFSPSSSVSGSTITITGTNLLGVTSVSIGGVMATSYTIVSATTITAVVGIGAMSGNVSVTGPGGAVSSPGFVLLTAPNIYYQTPQNYITGAAITPLLPVNTGGAVPATIYGQVSTFAGSGASAFINGTGNAASFDHPYGAAIDASGSLYVADCFNHAIRKISSLAFVSTLAGSGFPGTGNFVGTSASFNYPGGVVVDGTGNVYVGDQTNNLIRKITPTGAVSTFAGNGLQGSNNGSAGIASFSSPAGLVFDAAGNLYVADRMNNMVRKITPSGVVSTFAGSGVTSAVNGTGTAAGFYGCSGLAIDQAGNLYVADQDNHMIRKITSTGVVTTVAGSGSIGNANGLATSASFNQPFGVAVDVSGNIFVADEFNNLIRKITPVGLVSTLAGNGSASSIDAVGLSASFNYPSGVTLDGLGNMYITETVGNKIRKIILTGYTIDKTLPTGLSFSPTTGIISGTPTVASPATVYTITGYNAAGSSVTTVTIAVASPKTITFTGGNSTTITKNYGDPDFLPNATASSGLPVTYTSSNPAVATVTAGGNIHVVGVGTTVITATQPGNSTYLPAVSVIQTVTVLPVPLTISAPVSVSRAYGTPNPVFIVTYTGFVNGESFANLTIQPTISTTATVSSLPGTYPITVTGAVDPNYTISYVPGVLTVIAAQRALTFGPISNLTYGGPDVDPGATVDSGDPVMYTSSNPAVAIIVNGKIHIVGAGTDTITATVPNKPGYVNVAPVSQKLIINRAMQIITFAPIATQTMGSPDIMLIVTSDSGLPVTLSSSDPTIAVINGSMLKITGVGTATITATQPGNANYLPATATQTITIITMGTITVASNIVPNAFTPNGDGVNDNWDIPFLINYPNCSVKVFSRRGQMVFSSVGYPTPWDGKYNGTVLPVGAYYYIIDTKDVLGILSGTVNLIK